MAISLLSVVLSTAHHDLIFFLFMFSLINRLDGFFVCIYIFAFALVAWVYGHSSCVVCILFFRQQENRGGREFCFWFLVVICTPLNE